MSDPWYPSGPWTGYYNYGPGERHRMELGLTFVRGAMTGDNNINIHGLNLFD